MPFVIHKTSRLPSSRGSYNGVTWTLAGLMNAYRPFFDDRQEAERLAARLSEKNPVGFVVSEIDVN